MSNSKYSSNRDSSARAQAKINHKNQIGVVVAVVVAAIVAVAALVATSVVAATIVVAVLLFC